MIEANNPIDIGKSELKQYQKPIEDLLVSFSYQNKTRSLPDLVSKVDKEEPYVMTDLERSTYLAVREGMQVFRAVSELVGEKVGMKRRLIEVPSMQLASDPQLKKMQDFTYSFATYAASRTVTRTLEKALADAGAEQQAGHDLSQLALNTANVETAVMKQLVAPVYKMLVDHSEGKPEAQFSTPADFAVAVKEVFARYGELATQRKTAHPEFAQHIDAYQFRILDGIVLQGYEDKSTPAVSAVKQSVTFQPITAAEIVGNKSAKRKISRYIDRLALYNTKEQKNPMLELGGLSWSNLFDGPPGTGKSSLFRLAMTRLHEVCDQLELKYNIFTVDQSIKDEFYGKTGKILLQRLGVANDPESLSMGIFDDIDLLTSTRDDAQGADNDINNIIMQYMDGVFTVRRGNVINFAASNKPTGLDDAMRNRFNDRLLINGPETAEDFADMLVLLGGKMLDRKLLKMELGYKPFHTQDMKSETGAWSAGSVAEYMADRFAQYKNASVHDFGKFMANLRTENPKITGRSAKAIMEAIKERTADFDVPSEWLSTRAAFHDLPYEAQVRKLSELYVPITADVLFQEAQRYFDSEERFSQTEAEGHVTRGYNNMVWETEAQLRFYEEQVKAGDKSKIVSLEIARARANHIAASRAKTIAEANARCA